MIGQSSPTTSAEAFVAQIAEMQRRIADLERAARRAGDPIGSVSMHAASTAPAGYLTCDGAAVSRTTYAGLFAVIGTTWGVGNGSTTFNVPDLRGRAPIGSGTGSGLTARTLAAQVGEEAHLLTAAESGLPAHSHDLVTGSSAGPYTIAHTAGAELASAPKVPTTTVPAAAAASSHNNMQPSAVVNFIIRAV